LVGFRGTQTWIMPSRLTQPFTDVPRFFYFKFLKAIFFFQVVAYRNLLTNLSRAPDPSFGRVTRKASNKTMYFRAVLSRSILCLERSSGKSSHALLADQSESLTKRKSYVWVDQSGALFWIRRMFTVGEHRLWLLDFRRLAQIVTTNWPMAVDNDSLQQAFSAR